MKEETRKSQLTFICRDGSKRVITVIGAWNVFGASDLGKDIEGANFKFALVSIL